jgi:Tol biopolymer transport system component
MFELFLIKPDGTGLIQVGEGWNLRPVWSPDSQKIAYTYFYNRPDVTPNANGEPYQTHIAIVDVDGKNKRYVTDDLDTSNRDTFYFISLPYI